jgi:hypothetical protein
MLYLRIVHEMNAWWGGVCTSAYQTCVPSPKLLNASFWNLIFGYDEVLSGYQPGQMVERWANQSFEDHLCPRPQDTSLTMVGKNILTIYIYTHTHTHTHTHIPGQDCSRDRSMGGFDGRFAWINVPRLISTTSQCWTEHRDTWTASSRKPSK